MTVICFRTICRTTVSSVVLALILFSIGICDIGDTTNGDPCLETPNKHFGKSVAGRCDIDGDGTDDILVGAPRYFCDGGRVFVYNGNSYELMAILYGEDDYDQFGFDVSGIGDVNGDNRDDFIVGAPYADSGSVVNAGKAYVYSYNTATQEFDLLDIKYGTYLNGQLGRAVAGREGKIIIGAPGMLSGAGLVQVFFGLPMGNPDWYADGESAGDSAGIAVDIGDLNADKVLDYAYSAPFWDASILIRDVGEVVILDGKTGYELQRVRGEAILGAGGVFGYSIAMGKFDTDRFEDIVVGAPGMKNQEGAVYGYRGPFAQSYYDWKIESPSGNAGDWFGYSVAAVGSDVHDKGQAHLVVGAPKASFEKGEIHIFEAWKWKKLVWRWDHKSSAVGPYDGGNLGHSVADLGVPIAGDCDNFILAGAHRAVEKGKAFIYCHLNIATTYTKIFAPVDSLPTAKFAPQEAEETSRLRCGAYPNPFNPSTQINFSLPEPAHVKLEMFDILGRRVSTLVDRDLEAGPHSQTWDGSDFSSGVYLYRLQAGDETAKDKVLLLK